MILAQNDEPRTVPDLAVATGSEVELLGNALTLFLFLVSVRD